MPPLKCVRGSNAGVCGCVDACTALHRVAAMYIPIVNSLDDLRALSKAAATRPVNDAAATTHQPQQPQQRVALLVYGTPGAGATTVADTVQQMFPGAFWRVAEPPAQASANRALLALPPGGHHVILDGLRTAQAIEEARRALSDAGYTPVLLRVDDPEWHVTCAHATGELAQRWMHPLSLSVLLPQPHMRLVNDKSPYLSSGAWDLLTLGLPLVAAAARRHGAPPSS